MDDKRILVIGGGGAASGLFRMALGVAAATWLPPISLKTLPDESHAYNKNMDKYGMPRKRKKGRKH